MLLKVIALSCGLVSSVTVTVVPLVAAAPKVAVSLALSGPLTPGTLAEDQLPPTDQLPPDPLAQCR